MRYIFAVLFHSSMISILRYNAPRGISFTFAVNWTSAFPDSRVRVTKATCKFYRKMTSQN